MNASWSMSPSAVSEPPVSYRIERPQTDADRRNTRRLPCRLSATCRGEGETVGVRARVMDASVGGLCLLVGREYPAGSEIEIEMKDPTGSVLGSVRCVVAHASLAPTGLWRLGCTINEGCILPN